MDHQPLLISTLAVGLTAAFVGGLIARRLRLPAIVGYLLAGVAVGPFTPGLIADTAVATELAEIGIILLMFGVGIHFSIRDLLAVKSIAIPGAFGQIAVATALGVGVGHALGFGLGGALVLGLAISVASTVVLLRALMDRGELDSFQGRVAVVRRGQESGDHVGSRERLVTEQHHSSVDRGAEPRDLRETHRERRREDAT